MYRNTPKATPSSRSKQQEAAKIKQKNQKNHSCTKRAEKPHFTSATDYKTKSTKPTSADSQNTYHNLQQQYYKKKHKSNAPHNNRNTNLNPHTTRKQEQIQTTSHKPVTNYNKKHIIGKHYLQNQFHRQKIKSYSTNKSLIQTFNRE